MDLTDEEPQPQPKIEEAVVRRRPRRIKFPRREPSVVIPPREVIYTTADKTTCKKCPCFPKEDPYVRNKKLNLCQKLPLTLYELAAAILDARPMPVAFAWGVEDVVDWMADIGFPQYSECIRDNNIDGMRLLMLEDPSFLPEINIHYHTHIRKITSSIRRLYGTDFVWFARSVGLPPRFPLTHVVRFKSRTGPRFGWRESMSATDILRWMKILMPAPIHRDHWDLVWYRRPDTPSVKVARVPGIPTRNEFWGKKLPKEACQEYWVGRKFRMMPHIADEHQTIWKEHRSGSAIQLPKAKEEPKLSILAPDNRNIMLDRRKRPKVKFLG